MLLQPAYTGWGHRAFPAARYVLQPAAADHATRLAASRARDAQTALLRSTAVLWTDHEKGSACCAAMCTGSTRGSSAAEQLQQQSCCKMQLAHATSITVSPALHQADVHWIKYACQFLMHLKLFSCSVVRSTTCVVVRSQQCRHVHDCRATTTAASAVSSNQAKPCKYSISTPVQCNKF